jgi:hypothetical protein
MDLTIPMGQRDHSKEVVINMPIKHDMTSGTSSKAI